MAQDRAFADDLGITADVRRRWRAVGDFTEIGQAAGLIDFVGLFDRFIHSHHVGRPATLDQLADMAKNPPVIVAIKIAFTDDIRNAIPSAVIEQQAADQRLFRLDRMRRQTQGRDFEIGGGGRLKRTNIGHDDPPQASGKVYRVRLALISA
jgi:hypothetical protein